MVRTRSIIKTRSLEKIALCGSSLLVSLLSAAAENPAASPKWIESGLHAAGIGYRPLSIAFSPALAGKIKKAPEGLTSPSYTKFQTGPIENPLTHLVIVDFNQGVPKRLFVDANANGDLTDDPVVEVTTKTLENPNGITSASDMAKAMIDITAGGKTRGSVEFYYIRSNVSKPQAPGLLGYYFDCGVSSEVMIGGKPIHTVLSDDSGTTRFALNDNPRLASILWVDANRNNKPDRGEVVPAGKPFEVDGKWWKVSSMTPEGAIQIAETEKPAAPAAVVSKLDPGNKAPAFTAKTVDGKEIKFPDDYKGKIVLIDFWATWCGPCIAELPNVVKAYGAYHDKGLEVLGISLDKEGMAEKITAFATKNGMPWPQVYDGGHWSNAVAKLYEIHSIPHMILVDGDTGLILADKTIRGEALAPAIEKALTTKKSP